ncbi:hypothetical protein BD410DRAFT_790148 [Rickenella mellea]|uniref:Uncharacterized protein n=1 Tax=Rickenella mellea TaxID=50990 RepID=A0A4Y7Q1B0_9AGAM|nr:hypothetical protein BD410DRAFT_790148 [Rickenella mellea]
MSKTFPNDGWQVSTACLAYSGTPPIIPFVLSFSTQALIAPVKKLGLNLCYRSNLLGLPIASADLRQNCFC